LWKMAIRRTNIKFPRTLTLKDSLSHSRDSLHELTQSIRLTAVAVENLSAASGVAYRELGAILAFFFYCALCCTQTNALFPKAINTSPFLEIFPFGDPPPE